MSSTDHRGLVLGFITRKSDTKVARPTSAEGFTNEFLKTVA